MAMTLPEKARRFAVRAHGDQRYGKEPYSVHLDAVAELARPYGEQCEIIAYLHDVIEDTSTQPADILAQFGPDIAAATYLLTDPEGKNRKERKARLHRRLGALVVPSEPAQSGVGRYAHLVLIVKACDRLANLRQSRKDNPGLLKMYAREAADFREAAYRPGLCDPVWAEIDDILGGRS